MYMVIGIGSAEPTRWRTSFSRHVWFPPSPLPPSLKEDN